MCFFSQLTWQNCGIGTWGIVVFGNARNIKEITVIIQKRKKMNDSQHRKMESSGLFRGIWDLETIGFCDKFRRKI